PRSRTFTERGRLRTTRSRRRSLRSRPGTTAMPETPNPTRTALIRSWQVAHAALERKDPEKTLEAALASAVELTNAERGFVVLRRDGQFYATAVLTTTHRDVNENEKLFSVAMVELALEMNQVLLVN